MKIVGTVITSRSNPIVGHVCSLGKKKERDERAEFLCDGKKLVFEYIRACGEPALLFVMEEKKEGLLREIESLERELGTELDVRLASESAFLKMTEQKAPDGILCVGEKKRLGHGVCRSISSKETEGERIVILSSLQDSGNVGTVIRSALAFGYDRVVLSFDCADVYSAKTLRASMGAIFFLKVSIVEDLRASVEALSASKRRVFAAELRENARSLMTLDVRNSDVFVIGNEGHGIDDAISAACTDSVYIPIDERSESLNAAIAAGVLMWHQSTAK